MKEYAFGIDLGGTTAKVGLFTTSGALLEKWEVPTDTSNAGEHILENLANAIRGKMAEKEIPAEQVEGVGIGVPGPVLNSSVVPIVCANLGGWGERECFGPAVRSAGRPAGPRRQRRQCGGAGRDLDGHGEGLPQCGHGHAGHRRRRRRHRQRQGR